MSSARFASRQCAAGGVWGGPAAAAPSAGFTRSGYAKCKALGSEDSSHR